MTSFRACGIYHDATERLQLLLPLPANTWCTSLQYMAQRVKQSFCLCREYRQGNLDLLGFPSRRREKCQGIGHFSVAHYGQNGGQIS